MLQFVHLTTPDGKPLPGLVPVRSETSNLSIDERVAVSDAESFKQIDYVFFRRFSDNRSSQISAYVIDNSDQRLNEDDIAELHQQVWLHGTAPLLYVSWPGRIDILTCARGPDFWRPENDSLRYNPAKRFDAEAIHSAGQISEELRKFSAYRLADGTFWEDPQNQSLANYAKGAHQSLIQAVVEADKEIEGEKNPILRRLLLLMVLIKYLEDRQVFPTDGWFGRFHKGARNFFEVLKGGNPEEVYRLLNFLEGKFNGDIFGLPQSGRQRLTKNSLAAFADLVEARTLNRQRYLWTQFSFEHLPVEIISHLYQRFVQGGHGTIYTPPFLAALLLDHAMPYKSVAGREKILDPACGSGVFLVGAFRRLVNVWRSNNFWRKPDVYALKGILKQCIFGIELDPFAIDLTAFSLSLAICDALKPEVIWNDLKFDRLRDTNLQQNDFFQMVLNSEIQKTEFDIIIGNPPFKSKLTSSGMQVDKEAQKAKASRGKLPDKQVAYLFLEQAFEILRGGGRLCLIQPSGLLYNRQTHAFKAALMKQFKIEKILDFSSIRRLYEADPKTVAILAVNVTPAPDSWLVHLTFRRTVSVQERISFELDYYDRHRIKQREAESDLYVWRTNLLGGGRLREMSIRLRNLRTLAEYIEQNEWEYGEGYIAATTGRRLPAPFLTGKPLLPTEAFTETGFDNKRIEIVKEKRFRSAYTPDRFSAPLLLIKKTETLPIVRWTKGFLAYRHRIVGIHAPQSQASQLDRFYADFVNNHNLYRFYCALHSSESVVSKATAVRKQDIDILPYPENPNDLTLSFWEKIICDDVFTNMNDYIRLGQNSKLLKHAAGTDDLKDYATTFIRMLGTVYENLRSAAPIFLGGLICQPFYFGERPDLSWIEEQKADELSRLIYQEEKHAHLRTIKVLRFYSENVLLVIKPDRLRYWIRSTAIRDADDTLLDLRRQGY